MLGLQKQHNAFGKKIFDATPECDLTLKGVKGTVRARGFRLHSRPRRDSDTSAQLNLRDMRRSGHFERLSISNISISGVSLDPSLVGSLADSDEEDETRRDESRKSRRRSISQRSSQLDDLLEEDCDT